MLKETGVEGRRKWRGRGGERFEGLGAEGLSGDVRGDEDGGMTERWAIRCNKGSEGFTSMAEIG